MTGCGLFDMGFVGSKYTWSNRYTKERLDRAFHSMHWRECFPFSRVVTLPPSDSDHCPLLIEVETKINATGTQLYECHKKDVSKNKVEMRVLQEKMKDIMSHPHTPQQYDEQKQLHVRYSALLAQEETYWRQRSKTFWMKDGDKNTAFFHRKASNRRNKNRIKGLNNEAEAVDVKVTEEMNVELNKPYCEKEIKDALFQMHPSKSPGPDGMSPFFFQKYWSILSTDVCLGVQTFLKTGELEYAANFTHLCLIPKISEATEANQFRPIALCNVLYRIRSKVLANRLKQILSSIISPLQSAYVPGRLISDNTLVATEVAHFMYKLRRQEEGFFSLKLDISKAYDRLEWDFLRAMLTKLGFHEQWITIIMKCVASVQYSILVNGQPSKAITPTRGIRQGDPLSPYLFILCAEGLSALISKAVESSHLQGLKMCPEAPTLHHLFFADDSLIFGAASESECHVSRHILNTYELASGQKVNYQKSSVVFSRNVHPDLQDNLASVLEVQRVEEHDRYLGLPLRVGKSKTAIFSYIKERLTKKLLGWKSKILSSAGKEILIKAIAQTVPSYAMNCYLIPKTLCDDIHQLCAQFFWGDTDQTRKIHWRSWGKLCMTKQEGGLGFKNLYAYNLAMLAKQAWRLILHPQSLIAQVYKARYFPHHSFWDAELGDAPSFSWRSILESRPFLVAGIQWKVGTGELIDVWKDNWIPECPRYLVQKPPHTTISMVAELIDEETQSWKEHVVQATFLPEVADKILSIPLSRSASADRYRWMPEKNGKYTVKSAYWIARQQVMGEFLTSTSSGNPYETLWKKIWNTRCNIPIRIVVGIGISSNDGYDYEPTGMCYLTRSVRFWWRFFLSDGLCMILEVGGITFKEIGFQLAPEIFLIKELSEFCHPGDPQLEMYRKLLVRVKSGHHLSNELSGGDIEQMVGNVLLGVGGAVGKESFPSYLRKLFYLSLIRIPVKYLIIRIVVFSVVRITLAYEVELSFVALEASENDVDSTRGLPFVMLDNCEAFA
ncbi:uncharacterized protein LOC133737477 [Rosa rugosa]|uniref:uncharacterized protein LOC133737477 n=1 Tax=Rosa rugosa TaxID=74645 RepID=UPI002B4184F7|nr:uncharacterized protein LOC133737477 [Rosa rugosa]